MTFRKWLKEKRNISLKDYRLKSDEDKLVLFKAYQASEGSVVECDVCGHEMLWGSDVWEGSNRDVYDMSLALCAIPRQGRLAREKESFSIFPEVYVCRVCGNVRLKLKPDDVRLFESVLTDLDYH